MTQVATIGSLIQVCYPVADGVLWCNAIHYKGGDLRENPSGKGYKFPCIWARLKKAKKAKRKTATPLQEVAVLQSNKKA